MQRTIKKLVNFCGVGLHTGEMTNLKLLPADGNHGIVFYLKHKQNNHKIKASIENVVETNRGTTIGDDKFKIYTVEHLLSAIFSLGIDNLLIEIDNIEPPILDGSSKEFYKKISNAGVRLLNKKRKIIKIKEPIYFLDSKKGIEISILPADEFKVTFDVNYEYGQIGKQSYTLNSIKDFNKQIASARTFCSFKELIILKEKGLIKGGALDSAVVFLNKGIVPNDLNNVNTLFSLDLKENDLSGNTLCGKELRFDNEPVRHKILDLIGDFSLFGEQIIGHVVSKNSGHESNIKFLNIIKKEMKKNKVSYKFNKEQIKQVIPHRYPFLLIDNVIDVEPGQKVIAEKTFTVEDNFLEGHFPGNPIVPGVILIECMAQASCFLSLNLVEDRENKMMLLSSIKSAKFYKKVVLNDCIQIYIELLKFKLNTALFYGEIKLNNTKVTSSEFMATVVRK